MIIYNYETQHSSNDLFIQLKDEPYVMFLDASKQDKQGRYSILVANPKHMIVIKKDEITIDGQSQIGDPLVKLQALMDEYAMDYKSDLPFIGGFVGFFSYDLKHHFEVLPHSVDDDVDIPDVCLGLYEGGLIFDHHEHKIYITDADFDGKGQDRIKLLIEKLEGPKKHIELSHFDTPIEIKSNFDKEPYKASISKVRDYIKSGDIYQINMTQRFMCQMRESTHSLYQKLRKYNPAPYSSYIDFGTGVVASSSPERFINMKDRKIQARPIKGTMPRSLDPIEDEANKQTLIHSKKDQSELLMIVDLERNDLSKIAKRGSVEVTELFKLETYETVYHLVATIEAMVKDDIRFIDILKATFPGGSITGAPKIRAMEVIDELEPTSRGLYTGSIGYVDFNGDFDLNIVIRTFVIKDDKAYFQAGGGIVWDSDPQLEYEESLAKAFALKKALNDGIVYDD